MPQDEAIVRVADKVVRVNVRVRNIEGNGSGFIASEDGTVLTCEHVVRPNGVQPDALSVVGPDGQSFPAQVEQLDRHHDLATLKVKGLQGSAEFRSYSDVAVGDGCFVLGYPLGLSHLTVQRGTVSAKGNNLITGFPFELIQLDARINVGNSGGPVITESSGTILGLVSMKYIPFLREVQELQRFVAQMPVAPTGAIALGGVDWGAFFNYVNESTKRISKALTLVQVGIGWVIPSDHFARVLSRV